MTSFGATKTVQNEYGANFESTLNNQGQMHQQAHRFMLTMLTQNSYESTLWAMNKNILIYAAYVEQMVEQEIVDIYKRVYKTITNDNFIIK